MRCSEPGHRVAVAIVAPLRKAHQDWIVSQEDDMRDFLTFKKSAIRYWERRRIMYNGALVLPALFGYFFTDTLNWVGDPHVTNYAFVLPWFALSAFGANICYSFAYALEFLIGKEEPTSWWVCHGRSIVLFLGVLFAMLLALIGGHNIAQMEWYNLIKQVR